MRISRIVPDEFGLVHAISFNQFEFVVFMMKVFAAYVSLILRRINLGIGFLLSFFLFGNLITVSLIRAIDLFHFYFHL